MRHFNVLSFAFASALVLSACASFGATMPQIPAAAQLPSSDLKSAALQSDLKSSQFTVQVNGNPVDAVHAAASYDYVSIDATEPVSISITASEPGFWDHGVDIQPWRLGIRPTRKGQTIQFHLTEPAKLSISRPGDFLNHAKMLFLFFARPPAPPPVSSAATPLVHVIPAGIYRQSLNPKSGETYYLAPGAVIYGSLNLWKVENVKILGRGLIVYQGPQNPNDDDGWMQKPDWHCIGAFEARHIEIDGLTCLVRSRTWSIQMKDSFDFVYDDIRVIGGNPGNANQDGMDWLGGGNTVVRNSFFRASDDVFSMEGNWDGYHHDDMVRPGHDVSNILVENSVLSTSISNIVRAGWPEKTFNSRGFTLRNSDVLHSGIGSCGPPFALFTFWGANGAKGDQSNFTFENLWLDDWYSLFQIEQETPSIHGITFRNIWSLGQPPLVASTLVGDVKDIHIENVKLGQTEVGSDAALPVKVSAGAAEPIFAPRYAEGDKRIHAGFEVTPAVLEPGTTANFSAQSAAGSHLRYTWLFGDGETAQGQSVKHRYQDADGTELDGTGEGATGTGRFRVLLHVEDDQGHQDWAEQNVAVVGRWQPSIASPVDTVPGLEYRIYSMPSSGPAQGNMPDFPAFQTQTESSVGIATNVNAIPGASSSLPSRFAVVYEGYLDIPSDGGYGFDLMSRDGARLFIDGQTIVKPAAIFSEACGSSLNAVRYANGTVGLRAGKHSFRLEALATKKTTATELQSRDDLRLLWEGPGIPLGELSASMLSHSQNTALAAK